MDPQPSNSQYRGKEGLYQGPPLICLLYHFYWVGGPPNVLIYGGYVGKEHGRLLEVFGYGTKSLLLS